MTEAGGVTRSSAVAGDGQQTLLSPQSPGSLRHDLWPSWPDTMYQRSLGPLLGKLHVHLQRADHKQIINKGWPSKLSTNVLFCLTKEITKVWYSLFNPSINLLKFRVVYNDRENLSLKRCILFYFQSSFWFLWLFARISQSLSWRRLWQLFRTSRTTYT